MTPTRKCPKDGALVALAMNEVSPRKSAKLLRHVAACPRCSLRFNMLRQIKRDLEPKVDAFAGACATAAAPSSLPSSPPSASPSAASVAAAGSALLRDAARREIAALRPAGRPVPAPLGRPSPPRSRRFGAFFSLRFAVGLIAVLAVLTAGAFIALTRFQRHAVMRSPSPSLTLLAPLGKVSGPPRVLRWTPVLHAEDYHLEIVDDSLNSVYVGGAFLITETILPPSVRSHLVKGRTYVWTVSAWDGDDSLLVTRSGAFTIE